MTCERGAAVQERRQRPLARPRAPLRERSLRALTIVSTAMTSLAVGAPSDQLAC